MWGRRPKNSPRVDRLELFNDAWLHNYEALRKKSKKEEIEDYINGLADPSTTSAGRKVRIYRPVVWEKSHKPKEVYGQEFLQPIVRALDRPHEKHIIKRVPQSNLAVTIFDTDQLGVKELSREYSKRELMEVVISTLGISAVRTSVVNLSSEINHYGRSRRHFSSHVTGRVNNEHPLLLKNLIPESITQEWRDNHPNEHQDHLSFGRIKNIGDPTVADRTLDTMCNLVTRTALANGLIESRGAQSFSQPITLGPIVVDFPSCNSELWGD